MATNGFDGGVRNSVVADMMGVANRRLGVASASVSGRRVQTSFYTFFFTTILLMSCCPSDADDV